MFNLDKNNLRLVIFGRPNVGKSTFFNCLIEKNQALISAQEGTTRDSNIGEFEWRDNVFSLVDTGGILDLKILKTSKKKLKNFTSIDEKVQEKVKYFLKKADLIFFLVDSKDGILPMDRELALFLKKNFKNKKILLVANKVDNKNQEGKIADFNQLSLGEPVPISAITGAGTGDLLDIVFDFLHISKKRENRKDIFQDLDMIEDAKSVKENTRIKISIIGQPNAGKSSLLNAILGYERVIVSEIAHTTREPQDTNITYNDQEIKLIDTAGINRKWRRVKNLSQKGIEKSLITLKRSDVAVLVIDVVSGVTSQDLKIIEELLEKGVSFFILINKVDILKEKKDIMELAYDFYREFPFITWVPIVFTSVIHKKCFHPLIFCKDKEKISVLKFSQKLSKNSLIEEKVLNLALEIYKQRNLRISDSQFNKFLNKIVKIHSPKAYKGVKRPRIYQITQLNNRRLEFSIRIGKKDNILESYLRFIENQIRKNFGFLGTPIKIFVDR